MAKDKSSKDQSSDESVTKSASEELLDQDVLADVLSLAGPDHPKFFSELVGLYETTGAETLELMLQAEKAQDQVHLSRLAHKLKGMSINLGAKAVADHCARLEVGQAVPSATIRGLWERSLCELLKVSNRQ